MIEYWRAPYLPAMAPPRARSTARWASLQLTDHVHVLHQLSHIESRGLPRKMRWNVQAKEKYTRGELRKVYQNLLDYGCRSSWQCDPRSQSRSYNHLFRGFSAKSILEFEMMRHLSKANIISECRTSHEASLISLRLILSLQRPWASECFSTAGGAKHTLMSGFSTPPCFSGTLQTSCGATMVGGEYRAGLKSRIPHSRFKLNYQLCRRFCPSTMSTVCNYLLNQMSKGSEVADSE